MSHIHLLADKGDKAGVSQLIANGVQVNDPDGAGETPLHYAAIKGHSEVAVILISSGADPNIKSYRGTTPLHDAAKHGKLDAVTCLVDSNADIEAKDSNSRIPLHHAVENGHMKIVNKLLETNAATQINSLAKDGVSPLHLAAERGHIPIIKVLIEKGARLDLRDHKGNAALSSIPLVEKKPLESPQLGQQQLLTDIRSLFDAANGRFTMEGDDNQPQTLFSDVTFIVEGARINGHRNIIAARCHRLGKLFHQELIKDEIELRDITASTFEKILEWLYTEDVHALHATELELMQLFKLFQASERFHLRPLKVYCEALISQNVSGSNVGTIWSELRKMTPVPASLIQHCAHLIISSWNFVAGTKLGQEISREEVIYLLDQLTVAEPKELPKEAAIVKSSSRSSPKPARTKPATQPPPVVAPTPTHPKSRAAAAAAAATTPPAVHTPSSATKEVDMRMNDKNARTAKMVLSTVMKHKNAWPFNQPVDPVALGIPDYFDVIQNPMDLSTIKTRLDKGSYQTIGAFANDMRLVFNNAMKYNVNGSAVYNFAETLLKQFNSKYASTQWERSSGERDSSPVASPITTSNNKKRKSYGSPTGHNGIPSPLTPPSREHIKPESTTRVGSTPAAVKSEHPAQVPIAKPKPSPPPVTPMTFEDKKLLGEKMNSLTEDQLTKMVNILNSSKSQSGEQNDGDIEIDMTELDEVTLRNLEVYVNSCLAANEKESKKKKHKKGAEDEDIVVDDH